MATLPGVSAALLVLAAAATLATLLARLATAAHHADARSRVSVPWPLPVAAAVCFSLGALLRALRYATNTPPTVPELVLQSGFDASGAFLLATFLGRTARARFGGEIEGSRAAGGILLATSLASVALVLAKGTFTAQVQVFVALSLGALAWALSDLALLVSAMRAEPAWVRAFAALAPQGLLAGGWLRALLAGPDSTNVTRILLASTLLLAVLFALPAFGALRETLLAPESEARGGEGVVRGGD